MLKRKQTADDAKECELETATVIFLVFASIVGFGLLLVSRFNATDITPASNAVQGASQEVKAEPLTPTDKPELAQTDLIEVKPSHEVATAEEAMPAQGEPGYRSACQKMKQMYTNDQNAKLQTENSRFAAAQQDIINKYNREGRSFSSGEKSAHAREVSRHDWLLRQITAQYQKQLNKLSC